MPVTLSSDPLANKPDPTGLVLEVHGILRRVEFRSWCRDGKPLLGG